MRRTKEDAELTRQLLLESALKVFSEKGYADTRLSDVAKEANVTRGAIYWHFGNKKELFVALFKERVDPILNSVSSIFNEDLSPIKKIEKILQSFFTSMRNDKHFLENQHLELTEMKIRKEIPEIEEYMCQRTEKLSSLLKELIISGIEKGEIRKHLDHLSITIMLGIVMTGFGHIISAHWQDFNRSFNDDEIVDIFLKGISA